MIKMWSQYGGWIILVGTVAVIIALIVADIVGVLKQGLAMTIVTTILVATTMYYSLLNRRLLENNQLLLAATDSPKVTLAIRPWNKDKKQYVFVIENVGTGIAFDIKLKMLSNPILMLDLELNLKTACAEIKPIPPKQDYKLLIETGWWIPQDRETSFDIEVSYTNSQRTKLPSENFSLSIEASRYYLQGDLVAERLGEIVDHIKEIANQSSSTNTTDSFSTSDAQIEQERREKEAQERLAQEQEWREKEAQERLAQEQEWREKEEQERLAQEQEWREKEEQEWREKAKRVRAG